MVARGHGVTLVARRQDKLRELAEELGKTVRVEVIACDVADADTRAGLLDAIADRGLTVDILVNNAGVGTIGSITKTPVADEIAQVRVNVEAVIDLTTRGAADGAPRSRRHPQRRLHRRLSPVPLSVRILGDESVREDLHEGVGGELAGTGVTVAMLAPGPVRTEFLQTAAWTRTSSPRRSRNRCGCRHATWHASASKRWSTTLAS